jgi:hypothetical protein
MNDVSAHKWEEAAQRDAYGYIMGYAGADPEVFWKSGEAAVTSVALRN